MKKPLFAVLFAMFLVATLFVLAKNSNSNIQHPSSSTVETDSGGDNILGNIGNISAPAIEIAERNEENTLALQSPLDRTAERVTKKNFGLYITPETSPVRPDKFRGYHTGTDFEIFPEELDAAVPVRAICDGNLAVKKTASGYGGMAAQICKIDGENVSIVYGHLKLSSISKKIGENVQAGETIGILGKGFSAETDGARKHLHLGIHKGSSTNILGYVRSKSELSRWLDPCVSVCK